MPNAVPAHAVERRPALTPGSVWLLSLAVWTLLGVASAARSVVLSLTLASPPPWWKILLWQASQWYAWMPLAALVVVADRWARRAGPWRWPLHVPIAAAVILLHAIAVVLTDAAYFPEVMSAHSPTGWVVVHLRERAIFEILTYLMILGGWYAIDALRRRERAAVAAAHARAAVAQAELRALHAQMSPHFLFNALQSIAALNARDPKAGTAMLRLLADLFRDVLRQTGEQEVSLKEELEFIDRYLEIERTRFGQRLVVTYDVPPAMLDARVPHLILQPLVENAIRHGVARKTGPGHVWIRAVRDGDELDLVVEDDGEGASGEAGGPGHGQGLELVGNRLHHLYGAVARLTVVSRPGGGVRARVHMPWRDRERGGDA